MRTQILTLSVSLMALAAAAGAEPVISGARISDDVKVLSSDEFAGRGVATPAEDKVVAFVSKAYKDAGLEPGGENGGWTQTVKLRKFQVSDPALSLNLKGQTLPLVQGEDITASTRGALGAVSFTDTPLVFVGYGVTAPERGWDDFKDVDVKGKIIVVLINDPDFYQPDAQTFNGKAMTYYGRWTYKFEEAARKGAAGVMIIHDSAAASYGWNTVKNSWSVAQFDIVRPDPSVASPKLESWISASAAEKIFEAAGLDLNALKIAARSKDFKPVPLDGITLSGGYKVAAEEVVSRNIIGQLKGAKRPDETVFYMAHWDHIGIGSPDADGDAIFNGAVDNATGVAALIELARAFKASGKTPDRTVAFIAVTAEESGLLGSEYYASNPIYPLAKTVGGINMDALNVSGRTRNVEVVGSGQSSLEDDLKTLAAAQDRVLTPDETPEAGYFFRSDHFPLAKRGVPVLYAASGLDMVEGGVTAGRAFDEDYRKNRYHQANDEWSADWDLSGLAEDVALYYQLGAKLANSTVWPQWRETSEFKAARDKTAAARP
ncbi:M28 family metallopeptidase [Asticcacaulis sp. ZE23SCel15]|uniref:M28 family metallopeptidase n=1 Tax=Asticcacaulis sp. ZE23SCel15 TaxID=3059027 RepID=UPI00265F9D18|nr:M28 family metallopeptidase [Asticcacaulis sp. ZE23SCel15]WKL58034.1 M28 family metallopeptidase [Asticcacaulis sp. ZE23SCel15]